MIKLKKITTAMLIAAIIISNSKSLVTYANEYLRNNETKVANVNDIKVHWAKDSILYAMDSGWIQTSDKFRPDDDITRSEFIKIVNRAFNSTSMVSETYTDVKTSDWFYDDVRKGLAAGYLTPSDKFRPYDNITRQEASKIIGSIMKLKGDGKIDFKDANKIEPWAWYYVDGLSEKGIIRGNNGYFAPHNNLTRAEGVTILQRTKNITEGGVETIFTKSNITESIKLRVLGKSMPSNANISFNELSYLTITYLDYDGNTKKGEMVVNKKLADEVLNIFKDIYYANFPIGKMNLIDDYNASDHASMVDNNTSAFCYRTIAGTNIISKHGKGLAIDINPFYNPHVLKSTNTINPPEASKYANRNLAEKGMIKKGDAVYKAFTSRGWKWGGNWNDPDYQHFEKSI